MSLGLVPIAPIALAACDSGGTECVCPSAGLTVNIPEVLVGHVVSIEPSGLACAGAIVKPTPGSGVSASLFQVLPTQTGPCSLDIIFQDGTTFSDELTVVQTTGCCAGLRTTPPEAAEIDVPSPSDGGA